MKKTIVISTLLLSLAIFVPFGVHAAIVKGSPSVYVGRDEVVPDNLYAAGNVITIDGTIKGDLICAGMTVNINGQVEGDIICAGQNININGSASGSVRVAGSIINLNNKVGRNVNAAGGFVNFGSNADVARDVIVGAGNSELRGKINGDLVAGGGNMILDDEIKGSARLWIDRNVKGERQPFTAQTSPLTLTDKARINGFLEYTSSDNADIAAGAIIKGETKHNLPEKKPADQKALAAIYGWIKLVSLFACLVVGMVIVSVWREETKKIIDQMFDKVGPSLGWGVAVLFLTPILVIVLMITMIGIPLGLILGALWMIAIYVSKIFAAILLGRELVKKFWDKKKDSLITAMILGVFALWILCLIPIVGFAVCFVATLWGLGGLWLFFKRT